MSDEVRKRPKGERRSSEVLLAREQAKEQDDKMSIPSGTKMSGWGVETHHPATLYYHSFQITSSSTLSTVFYCTQFATTYGE